MALPPTRLTNHLYACRPLPADMVAQLARHGYLDSSADRAQILALVTDVSTLDPTEAPRVGPTLQDRVAQALLASPFLSPKGRQAATLPPYPNARRPTRLENALAIVFLTLGAFGMVWVSYLLRRSSHFPTHIGPVLLALAVYVACILGLLRHRYDELPPQASAWAVLLVPAWYCVAAGLLAGLCGGFLAGTPGLGTSLGGVYALVHRGMTAFWRRTAVA